MTNADIPTILERLELVPGAIATEIGTTPAFMIHLEKQKLVERVGQRKTGKRGRPPVEWAVRDAKAPVKQEDDGPFKLLTGAPKLPEITEHTAQMIPAEQQRQIAYIEKVFAGAYGQRELGDYKILAERYKEIVRTAER